MELRRFLRKLEEEGELRRIAEPVDPEHEIGAVCFMELRRGIHRNQALWFERVRGSSAPLVVNLLASPKRFFSALGLPSGGEWHRFWLERTSRPIDPVLVERAPCQEAAGGSSKLSELPIPLWNEKDGGRYLTMPCVISRDPETNQRNCGIYRMMLHEDGAGAGILAPPYRHLAAHLAKSFARGEALPVAVALGVAPAVLIAAATDFPCGVDEIAMAGALQGAPVEMVPCRTIPLEVPAAAEVVLEGTIAPGDEKAEGPFGEFTGYYSSGPALRPVLRIGCVTHRKDPVVVGSYVGRPPQENSLLNAQLTAVEVIRQCPLPGIRDLHLDPSGVFNAVVSVRRSCADGARSLARAILSTQAGRRIKTLVIVGEEIDPRDPDQVSRALAYGVRPDRDVEIVGGMPGVCVDPSLPDEERLGGTNRTSKMIIDATRAGRLSPVEECLPRQDVLKRVERNWRRYGGH
ncbi:MAG TPA: UbiD family decarboxylase [candidate division Zixibacteria bacterium]|nr:UbiD family decarboxylase [candidate division Zixibacteria bacterium]